MLVDNKFNTVVIKSKEFEVVINENKQGIIVDVYPLHDNSGPDDGLIYTGTFWNEDYEDNDIFTNYTR